MRVVRLVGIALASAVACVAPGYEVVDSFGDADEGGNGGDAPGGGAGGFGGSGGNVSPTGGDGGEDPGSGGSSAGNGGSSGKGGGSSGGSATTGGSSNGGSSGKGGSSNGGSATTGGNAGNGGTDAGAGGSTSGMGGIMFGGRNAGGRGGAGGAGGTAGSNAGSGGSSGSTAGTGSGGKSGTVLFFDDFETGTDGWTTTPTAIWAIATDGSSVFAATGAVANSVARTASAGDPSWTNVQIDARVKITSFVGLSTSYFAGICARYQNISTYACFALRSDGKVAFRVNGSNTSTATPPGGDIVPGTWYTVRVVAFGSGITAFVNGTEIPAGSRVTSGAPTSGSIALMAPGLNAVFDDVRVTVP